MKMIEKIAIEIGGLENDRCNPCTEKKIIKCKDCLDAAKRVLTAMLEPTEEMIRAGSMIMPDYDPGDSDFLECWQAAINQALKE